MDLTKYWVVALTLILTTCRLQIVFADEKNVGIIVPDLIEIVKSCYGDHIDAVGIAGHVPDNLIRTLNNHLIPVVLFDDSDTLWKTPRTLPGQILHKLPVFIIGASGFEHFENIIVANIDNSPWKNHMASYFILDSADGCRNIGQFLYLAWRLDVINAKVVCSNENNTLIGAFNPFMDQAPLPWERIGQYRIKNKNPFTAYIRYYEKSEAICTNLDFDKTTDLNGSVIRVDGLEPGGMIYYRNQSKTPFSYNFLHSKERFMRIIFGVLHANPTFSGSTFVNGPNVHDFDMVGLPSGYNAIRKGHSQTYPHQLDGYVIITRFRGHKSQLQKILTVIDIDSRYGVAVVYLITLIFLKFCVHQALVPSLLNLVRITCNTGFTNLSNNTAPRIFLTGLLFFVVTIQGIYQGNLASLLTTVVPLRDVHTMQDLADFGYEKIYGDINVDFINHSSYIRERFVHVYEPLDCLYPVIDGSSAACIAIAQGGYLDVAAHAKLHVSRQYVETTYSGYIARSSWPLLERVDKIVSRMVEGSVLEPWDVKCSTVKFTDLQYDEEVMANVEFKNIELKEVTFALIILGIGLVSATITFIIELAVHRIHSRVMNVRVQILN